jgi:dolichyl-phosphate beta-glucosyltransferase
MKLISLIIPAFNEAASIQPTIGEAFDYFDRLGISCEIIVAADGTDGTREAAVALAGPGRHITVIGQPERRGKGRGIRQSVGLCAGDVIGFVDADNKTPISEFDKVEQLLRDGCDVVIGSRGLRASRIERPQPLYRRLGSKGFGLFMHMCVGLNDIVDTQCGFKFFRGDVARELFRLQRIDGYMFDVEILFVQTSSRIRSPRSTCWKRCGPTAFDVLRSRRRDQFTESPRSSPRQRLPRSPSRLRSMAPASLPAKDC